MAYITVALQVRQCATNALLRLTVTVNNTYISRLHDYIDLCRLDDLCVVGVPNYCLNKFIERYRSIF